MNTEIKEIIAYSDEYGWVTAVYNDITPRTKYAPNEIRVYDSGVCEIDVYDACGNYKNTGTFSVEDLETIKQHKWYEDSVGYLSTTLPDGEKVRMHRMLFPGQLSDHYDENKLNNTRDNLQQIPHAINITKTPNRRYNPQGATGIFLTVSQTWMASIIFEGKRRTKNFKTKEEALLMRYIWELNLLKHNAPQLQQIKEQYPRLVEAMLQGIFIVENPKHAMAILGRLSEDEHCPCSILKTPETRCMCKAFRMQESGKCHCGLYEKL